MLDRWTGEWIKPALQKTASLIEKTGATANQLSVIGFLIGMAAIPVLWSGMYFTALALILLNRLLDGLDGVLARMRGPTDAGGFLDITLDFIFYSAVPLGFALANPQQNALAAVVLIFSFVGTGTSFLAFAIMAAKNDIRSIQYPNKSMHYLGGITEGTETIFVLVLFCLFPAHFPTIAYVFAGLCLLTTILRIIAGFKTLKK